MPNAKPKKGVPPGGVPTEIAGLFLSSLSLLGFLAAEALFVGKNFEYPKSVLRTLRMY